MLLNCITYYILQFKIYTNIFGKLSIAMDMVLKFVKKKIHTKLNNFLDNLKIRNYHMKKTRGYTYNVVFVIYLFKYKK